MTEWHRVAKVDDIDEGEPFVADIDEVPLALYRVGGEYFALGDICPHRGDIQLSDGYLVDATIECPMHQSRFDVTNGEVLAPPATEDVPCYRTRIEDGEIYVEL